MSSVSASFRLFCREIVMLSLYKSFVFFFLHYRDWKNREPARRVAHKSSAGMTSFPHSMFLEQIDLCESVNSFQEIMNTLKGDMSSDSH